jgi:hypothetical protein
MTIKIFFDINCIEALKVGLFFILVGIEALNVRLLFNFG